MLSMTANFHRNFTVAQMFRPPGRHFPLAVVLLLVMPAWPVLAQTGTFIDRSEPTDLRVVTYNIKFDSIFLEAEDGPTQAPKFARVMQALEPDVINLQEIYDHSAAQTASLMNSILPLGGGDSWYALKSYDNILVSKYPLTMTATDTIPEPSSTSVAMALVDLPDGAFDTDFYFMNTHMKCCGSVGSSEDIKRQQQADALVNWMRDARTPGGHVNLPTGTPMAAVGDFNMVGSLQPLNTLITGNIINEGTYGSDSPPDWDGSDLTDLHPLHNAVGPDDYTYRSGSYTPSRLDFVLYTDSVVDVANNFVLNTVSMSSAQRAATGLQTYDVTFNSSYYDHLPVVVDFRFDAPAIPGDYDGSGYVDDDDYDLWRMTFGSTSMLDADGNGDLVVDAADYVLWRANLGAGTPPGSGAAAAVPEPTSAVLWCWVGGILAMAYPRWRRLSA